MGVRVKVTAGGGGEESSPGERGWCCKEVRGGSLGVATHSRARLLHWPRGGGSDGSGSDGGGRSTAGSCVGGVGRRMGTVGGNDGGGHVNDGEGLRQGRDCVVIWRQEGPINAIVEEARRRGGKSRKVRLGREGLGGARAVCEVHGRSRCAELLRIDAGSNELSSGRGGGGECARRWRGEEDGGGVRVGRRWEGAEVGHYGGSKRGGGG